VGDEVAAEVKFRRPAPEGTRRDIGLLGFVVGQRLSGSTACNRERRMIWCRCGGWLAGAGRRRRRRKWGQEEREVVMVTKFLPFFHDDGLFISGKRECWTKQSISVSVSKFCWDWHLLYGL
jgi:hypothetical protein